MNIKKIFYIIIIIFITLPVFTIDVTFLPEELYIEDVPIGGKYHAPGFDIINNGTNEIILHMTIETEDFNIIGYDKSITVKPGNDNKKPVDFIIESKSNLPEGKYEGKIKISYNGEVINEYSVICSFKRDVEAVQTERVTTKKEVTSSINYTFIVIIASVVLIIIILIVIIILLKKNKKEHPTTFIFKTSEGNITEYRIDNRISIGRDKENVLQINDRKVSSRHAILYKEGKKVIFEDLNSTNGSFINRERVTGKKEVYKGDIILISGYEIELM